ncbi:LytR/AlgR family response regulator transcription factor, partial [Clostridiisalibacter paucivorans]|uniref:LytR/AlgR family response regulator transcription factor n=1 Tax=Clostridiisalibacter paucivorans TaxID=408753 RepID=UPI00054E5CEF
MLTAVLIDDEYCALEVLKMELEVFSELKVMGTYTYGRDALKKISAMKPDVVFLDIEMEEMDGLELFNKIVVQSPNTKIVFVTAYHQYAEKAFELGALDYIIKPVKKERLAKTLKRLKF